MKTYFVKCKKDTENDQNKKEWINYAIKMFCLQN